MASARQPGIAFNREAAQLRASKAANDERRTRANS
jgi:hypothetical protein